MASKFRSALIKVTLTLALAAVGICALGWFLSRPAMSIVGAAPADLGAVNVAITGGSTDSVCGWFAPGRAGAGAVLLLHPVRGNRTDLLGRARFLHAAGYSVLLIDLQAHGETRGSHITFGAREALDASVAVHYLRTRAPEEKIGVIGISLGGAAALLGPGPLHVDAFVLEAVYPTITEAIADRLRIRFGPLGAAFAPTLAAQLRAWTGVSASALRPIDAIAHLQAPLLLLAGATDSRTTLAESQRLFAAAPPAKQLWIVSGAGHEDFHTHSRVEYETRIDNFFRRHLRGVG